MAIATSILDYTPGSRHSFHREIGKTARSFLWNIGAMSDFRFFSQFPKSETKHHPRAL
jgi:hypothetical protein